MAEIKNRFFYHEKGNHDETWYYLARDTESNNVYVIHAWAHGRDVDEAPMAITDFLNSGRGTAQDNLLKLLGLTGELNASRS